MSQTGTTPNHRVLWTFAISSIALFMAALDNLVVTTALPVIRESFHANLAELEWIVNAYTLTFAVLLLTGAALGDRFGRKRMFVIGLAIFTGGSVIAALSNSVEVLIAARAIQGVGGAIITPLSLTILSAAVPQERRAVALGAWGAVAGLAIAIGPLVGGAISEGLAWQWIFWLNVPIGLVAIPLALTMLTETYGPKQRLDLPGLAIITAALFSLVYGLVRGNELGWGSTEIVAALTLGIVGIIAFVGWEARSAEPMLPLRLFRSRTFSAANIASLFMYFGMFGSIFLLAQFFQIVQGYSPFQAGLRTLPWTLMPIFVAPTAGFLSTRTGTRPLVVAGLASPGARAGLAVGRRHADRRLRHAHPAVRARRRRHGPVLRPDRERRPVGRPARGGRQGVRREQRDPRDRWRVRRGRPRVGLLGQRVIPQRRSVRRRADPGTPGGSSRSCGRGRRCPGDRFARPRHRERGCRPGCRHRTGRCHCLISFWRRRSSLEQRRRPCPAGRVTSISDAVQIYDPSTGTFTLAGRMPTPRLGHAAVLLDDGGRPGDARQAPRTSKEGRLRATLLVQLGPDAQLQPLVLPQFRHL